MLKDYKHSQMIYWMLQGLRAKPFSLRKNDLISMSLYENSDKENKKEVVVKVVDTGSGIDNKIYPKIFSKFATKSHQGTGLGLFISKSIIEAHGGRIWAEKNNYNVENKGATFIFTLPIVDSTLDAEHNNQK